MFIRSQANYYEADPARPLGRILVDSDGETMGFMNYVYEVSEQSEIRRTFRKAPHIPIAGASSVPVFKRELQVDLLFLDD